MDPNATWDALLKAYATKDWKAAAHFANVLLHWLDIDGFPPNLTIGNTTGDFSCQLEDDDWNKALARSACVTSLQRAEQEVRHAAH